MAGIHPKKSHKKLKQAGAELCEAHSDLHKVPKSFYDEAAYLCLHALFFIRILFIRIIRLRSGNNRNNLRVIKAQIMPKAKIYFRNQSGSYYQVKYNLQIGSMGCSISSSSVFCNSKNNDFLNLKSS